MWPFNYHLLHSYNILQRILMHTGSLLVSGRQAGQVLLSSCCRCCCWSSVILSGLSKVIQLVCGGEASWPPSSDPRAQFCCSKAHPVRPPHPNALLWAFPESQHYDTVKALNRGENEGALGRENRWANRSLCLLPISPPCPSPAPTPTKKVFPWSPYFHAYWSMIF